MFAFIDQWFEPVAASQDYKRGHLLALTLVIAAGAWLRFWHLGNVGLHGDEDIMGLAARGIVAHGIPVLPSDMVYWRAPLHTYLLAGSTMLFGDTEWALRLPSAIVGSLCGLLAFFVGRRFLDPLLNVGFAALVTFVPAMIEVSQTARMYVFLVAGVLAFCILLFRWEKSGAASDYLLSLLILLLTVQFHRLAVFAAPMLFFPGLANRSRKQALLAIPGVALSVLFSEWTGRFANRDYPDENERLPEAGVEEPPVQVGGDSQFNLEFLIPVLIVAAIVAVVLLAGNRRRRDEIVPTTLVIAAAAACTMFQYHAGIILMLFGVVLWLRRGGGWARLAVVFAILVGNAVLQFSELDATGAFPGRKIIGAFVGIPSIWPTIRFADFSLVGAGIVAVAAMVALIKLSRGARVPMYFLFIIISVWVPLAAIGLFAWSTPLRYMTGPMPFFLLAAIACAGYLTDTIFKQRQPFRKSSRTSVAALVGIVACIANPPAAWTAARNGYDRHPDHKGAAQYVRSEASRPGDIVIAEDSIVQTYYLGHVDYRLQSEEGARRHSKFDGVTMHDQYTGAAVLESGMALQRVLDEASRDVFIIESAQVSAGLRARNRGNGIAEVLSSAGLEERFIGQDRETTVWVKAGVAE
jgi:hypothetical protein